MHLASTLSLPQGSVPLQRPERERRGTRRLLPSAVKVGSRAQLLQLGLTETMIRRELEAGTLLRIASGWYARPGADPRIILAIASGNRITCIDAAELHGLWIPRPAALRTGPADDRLHVYGRGRPSDRRAGTPPGAQEEMLLHGARRHAWPESDPVASLPLALRHAIDCLDGEGAAILLESALDRRLLSVVEVEELLAQSSVAARSRIGPLSAASESGSETRVVRWLRRRGFEVEQQVHLAGVGYLDVYVAGLFLEIDGKQHHSTDEAFRRDRRRDLRTVSHGLQILRLSYEQVWHQWESTKKAVLESIDEVGGFGRRKKEGLLQG